MMSAFHRTDIHDRTDGNFVVHYSGRYAGFYMARILPLFAVFTILALLYLDDESRRLIFSRYPSIHKPFSWLEFSVLLAFMTAPVLDIALTLARAGRGKIALSISPEGVTGAVRHMTRLLKWNEIADITVDGKFLVVRRPPRSLLQKIFAGRGLGDIFVPVHHLDRNVHEILAAVRQFAPAQHLRNAA